MKKSILAILSAVILTSCGISADDIYINDFQDTETIGVTLSQAKFITKMEIVNDSRHNIRITDGLLTLSDSTGEVFDVILDEEVLIPKKTTAVISVPLTLKFQGLGIMKLLLSGSSVSLEDLVGGMNVSYTITAKSKSIKHTFRGENIPVTDFARSLGLDNN